MKPPSFAIVVNFQVQPGREESFLKRVLQQASESLRLEEGCKQFDVLVDQTDSAIVVLYETYDDAAAFEDHRATSHFADFNQTVTPWVLSKEVRRLNLVENASS